MAARVLIDLQTMVTRRVDVFDPAVITIAQVIAGTTTNIIPETALLGGTIRTVSAATRAAIHERIREVAAGAALATGAAVEVGIEPGYPVTVNDPGFTAFAREAAAELLGDDRVTELSAPIMGAEDFSYVLERVPGTMAFLGASPAGIDPDAGPQNHSNLVVFDEAAMADGVATHALVASATSPAEGSGRGTGPPTPRCGVSRSASLPGRGRRSSWSASERRSRRGGAPGSARPGRPNPSAPPSPERLGCTRPGRRSVRPTTGGPGTASLAQAVRPGGPRP